MFKRKIIFIVTLVVFFLISVSAIAEIKDNLKMDKKLEFNPFIENQVTLRMQQEIISAETPTTKVLENIKEIKNYDEPLMKPKIFTENKFIQVGKNKLNNLNFDETYIQENSVQKNIASVVRKVTEVLITDDGFIPKEVVINVGEEVLWRNKRTYTKTMITGMRELINMHSTILGPDEVFRWKFEQSGEFVYIDAVMIGRTGKVVVKDI